MTIKIKKSIGGKQKVEYRGSSYILTPHDIKEADSFDAKLNSAINKIENILLALKALSKSGKKNDPLLVWYTVGSHINEFLRKNSVSKEDERLFWESLYGRSSLLQKTNPKGRVGMTRNDFVAASLLARYSYGVLEKVGPWALWREILSYKSLTIDERLLKWLIDYLEKKNTTRDGARPLLKGLSTRFKKIDTTVLSDWELLQKLKEFETLVH